MALATGIASKLSSLGVATRIDFMSGFARLRARVGLLSPLKPPFVVISCGTVGESRARELRCLGHSAFWVHIDPPTNQKDGPDLVFIPSTDWENAYDARPEYVLLDGVPHEVRKEEVDALRGTARKRLGLADGEHAVAFLIGGPSPAFDYDAEVLDRLAVSINAAKRSGSAVLASCSRRTTSEIKQVVACAVGDNSRVYRLEGANPYRDFLAASDAIVVSEDSVTMCCEAVATGKPVYLLRLSPCEGDRLRKVRAFQRRMQDLHNLLPYLGSSSLDAPGSSMNETARAVDVAFTEVSRRLGL